MSGEPGQRTDRVTWSRPVSFRIACVMAWLAVVTIVFVQPLTRLIVYTAQSELHSYIPLVPFVAAWLLYIRPPHRDVTVQSSPSLAIGFGVLGTAALVAAMSRRTTLSVNDSLGLMALAYLSFAATGGLLLLGSSWMRAAAFPLGFLILLIPLPDAAVDWLEKASVQGSADVAAALLRMTGTPLLRDGTTFALPGITLQIAQECSGIRSSWVLVIFSLLASHLVLKSRWRQAAAIAFVIPLGIVRNGFRILVIGLLCVYVSPTMIDSPIHRRGGPLFFVLSLIPLFAVLSWLRRQEP